jgi:hypothetical protein
MNTTKEIALKAIKKTEESRKTYANIRLIAGNKKEKAPLTQIDINDPDNPSIKRTITTKLDMEDAIIQRNQHHARQALQTPIASSPSLTNALDPLHPNNRIDQILEGSISQSDEIMTTLSPTEQEWIKELKRKLSSTIDTHITIDDFKTFFKHRKERTASSPSGRHMGIYKILADRADYECHDIVHIIIMLINTSILTSRPLKQWKRSSQIMIEKGKGQFIKNLRIIQLCEADLNFCLHIIWGNRLIRSTTKGSALDTAQFALPGMTCQSAVWNKVLFCDLLRQNLSTGIMTDYDATAAFDRVLHAVANITCHHLGLPQHVCLFMHNLLQQMEFNIATGFGSSISSFHNNSDPLQIGQGVLQGSSSAAPLYNVTTDICLTTFRKLAKGTSFTHPHTGETIEDIATQYVDDKTDMLNDKGAGIPHQRNITSHNREQMFNNATSNSNTWASLLWISGGKLNTDKCFYYYLQPKFNFTNNSVKYLPINKTPGEITIDNLLTNTPQTIQRFEPHVAKRTL